VQRHRSSAAHPRRQGFAAATRWMRAGKCPTAPRRAMATRPSSSGCRSD
jgi:hypothetical protein